MDLPEPPSPTSHEEPSEHPQAIEHTLRDGTRVRIRPITPADKERLQRGMQALSLESRYRRFMGAKKRLTSAELRYLTEIDHRSHLAWIAVDPTAPDQPGVGVARCVRLPDEPAIAEAAITVADSHQGRGLGTVLLRVLVAAARERGIEAFRAYVLADNAPMLHILARHGPVKRSTGGSVLLIDMPLRPAPERSDGAPHGLLRAVARRALPNVLNPFGNG